MYGWLGWYFGSLLHFPWKTNYRHQLNFLSWCMAWLNSSTSANEGKSWRNPKEITLDLLRYLTWRNQTSLLKYIKPLFLFSHRFLSFHPLDMKACSFFIKLKHVHMHNNIHLNSYTIKSALLSTNLYIFQMIKLVFNY